VPRHRIVLSPNRRSTPSSAASAVLMVLTACGQCGSSGRKDSIRALTQRAAPSRKAIRLSPDELASIFHLPVSGATMESAPVRLAPRLVPKSEGVVLCRADGPKRISVKIGQADRRQHLAISGPTGSGKSALLMSLALQDVGRQSWHGND